MPDETKKAADSPAAPVAVDPRAHPRYRFTATVDVVEETSGMRITARVGNLSRRGCYVDTNSPFLLGAVAKVRITKGTEFFEAQARVVYSLVSKGMGLLFTAVEPEQRRTLATWLAESAKTSWLASNRRSSQRILVKISVRVSGQNTPGPPLQEDTHTLAVNAHGASILLSTPVNKGQGLTLSNVQTGAVIECVVAYVSAHQGDRLRVGVQFALPNPTFWHVAFPPDDWTPSHPDAKSPDVR